MTVWRSMPPGIWSGTGRRRTATPCATTPKVGLRATVRGRPLLETAREVLAVARAGLVARGRKGAGGTIPDEAHFLNPLLESVESGATVSDEMLDRYHGEWGGKLAPIYSEYAY